MMPLHLHECEAGDWSWCQPCMLREQKRLEQRNDDFSCMDCLEQYSQQLKSTLCVEAVDED